MEDTNSPAEPLAVTIRVITQYLATMHDGKPIRIRQRHSMAALLDVAEYIAAIRGHRSPADQLRYVHAISRMQGDGQITVEEVWEPLPVGQPREWDNSHVVVTLTPEALLKGLSEPK